MFKIVRLLPLLSLLLTGCVHSTITNLTPSQQPRNATGIYPIEVAWDTHQQTVRQQTLTPVVMVDFDTFPMRPTRGITNRWEAFIPVPANQKGLNYHFKFDYEYNKFGGPQKSSKLSHGYKLDIVDK